MQRLVREDQDRPQIALTFDDGPDEKYTEKLLDGLKERGIKASFFLLGKSIEGNEHIVKRMHREGHLIIPIITYSLTKFQRPEPGRKY